MNDQTPLQFQELYLELTYRCNAECDHCYVSSGPQADNTKLGIALACQTVEQMLALATIAPKVTLAGGEPTLLWKDLFAIITYAAQRGCQVVIITNGWWGRLSDCDKKLDALIDAGLARLEISNSPYHRKYVDPSSVQKLLDVCRSRPIEVAMHVRTNRSYSEAALLECFDRLDHVQFITGPIMRFGRAAAKIKSVEFPFVAEYPTGCCQNDLSLVVTPQGNCYPCCGGSELTHALRLGNIKEESLQDIVARANERVLLHCLTKRGPAHLARALVAQGFTQIEAGSYVEICDLCTAIFRSPALARAAEEWANSADESCAVTTSAGDTLESDSTRALYD